MSRKTGRRGGNLRRGQEMSGRRMIKVPDLPQPRAVLCWKQSATMVRCDRMAGHQGKHSWDL